MVYLSKIYTRTGDDGTTALGDGTRLPKTHPRIASYGSADELGAVIGVATSFCADEPMQAVLRSIQNDLFDVGADLCLPPKEAEEPGQALRVTAGQVARLEREIDAANAQLEPLTSFVLSGGGAVGAHLHLARTVARRCERDVLRLAESEAINPELVHYLNRLSDLLFVLARLANRNEGAEVLWNPGDQQEEGRKS